MSVGARHNSAMPRLQRKSFETPDQVRQFAHGRVEVIELDETAIGRIVYEPGWRWSTDVQPLVGTTSCQVRHLGVVTSGRLHLQLDDGSDLEIGPNDAYEIPPGHDGWVVGDETFVTTEFASARTYGAAPAGSDERILATILFTDIVDSTKRVSNLGDAAWKETLAAHDERAKIEIGRHQGTYVNSTGDGLVARFDGPARAVRCALAIGAAVRPLGLEIRAGCHTGEVELSGADVRGVAVHIGARVAALAEPGQVLVSSTVKDLVAGSRLAFEDWEHMS
jgi:hypothetical protein